MIKGTKLEINGTEYIFAPLTIGFIEMLEDDLSNMQELPFKKQVSLAIDLATASLKRNYKDITREQVANEIIDVSNMWEVVSAVAQVSQLTSKSNSESSEETKK